MKLVFHKGFKFFLKFLLKTVYIPLKIAAIVLAFIVGMIETMKF